VPQISITTQTMIHGSNALQSCVWLSFAVSSGLAGFIVAADSSRPRNAGEIQSSRGCQTLRNRIRQPIEISDAPISTIHGLMKFEITNCGIANDTPVTRIAGQIAAMPRKPANAQISQNGTIREKNGNCRPTIAPRT
jgi:hypothetical protein